MKIGGELREYVKKKCQKHRNGIGIIIVCIIIPTTSSTHKASSSNIRIIEYSTYKYKLKNTEFPFKSSHNITTSIQGRTKKTYKVLLFYKEVNTFKRDSIEQSTDQFILI